MIWIQKDAGEWFDEIGYSVAMFCNWKGYSYTAFEEDSNWLRKSTRTDIVIGCTDVVRAFWNYHGIQVPKALAPMQVYSTVYFCACEDLKFPFFIKPLNDVKLFTGTVVQNVNQLNILRDSTPGLEDTTEVAIMQDMGRIDSEWRVFLDIDGKIKGIRHYKGDFDTFPDMNKVHSLLRESYPFNHPVSIDIGINGDGTHFIIEANDFWALGGYGLDPEIYLSLIRKRFNQIEK